jgi:hypothetical protein
VRHTDTRTDRHGRRDGQTRRRCGKQTDRHTYLLTDKQTYRQADAQEGQKDRQLCLQDGFLCSLLVLEAVLLASV